MKPKKYQKPLELKKQTVVNLQNHELSKIRGGACTYPETGCNSIAVPVCCSINPNTCTAYQYCLTNANPGCRDYTLGFETECICVEKP